MIPDEKKDPIMDKLTNFVLKSKNEEKMPSQLANKILYLLQNDILKSKSGLIALLEASLLLEPEKTAKAFMDLQMPNIAEQIGEAFA